VQKLGWAGFTFDWLIRQDKAIYCLVFGAMWHHAGLIMVVMLSGLRGFDPLGLARRADRRDLAVADVSAHRAARVPPLIDLRDPADDPGRAELRPRRRDDRRRPGFASDLPASSSSTYAFERGNVGLRRRRR
jgi:glucose/mannose transport system permease protein